MPLAPPPPPATTRGGAAASSASLATDVVHVLDAAARGTPGPTYIRGIPKVSAAVSRPLSSYTHTTTATTTSQPAPTPAVQPQPQAQVHATTADEREKLLEAHRRRMTELDRE
jgi:hypothetical protein